MSRLTPAGARVGVLLVLSLLASLWPWQPTVAASFSPSADRPFAAAAASPFSADLPPAAAALARLTEVMGEPPFQTTRIFDRHGNLLYEIADRGRRTVVSLDRFPAKLVQATIATEDKAFYLHEGVDPIAIARATLQNLMAGDIVAGGSTIPQQLARILLMDEAERYQQSFFRKVREASLAFQLSQRYSKDQILEMYLNSVYYGNQAYGAAAAAQTYFNKDVSELTLAECAFLAGLPQAPNYLDPFTNFERAKQRQRVVLELMRRQGYITEQQKALALAAPINLVRLAPIGMREAPHFVDYVRDLLQERYGTEGIRQGLEVHTSIDLRYQKLATEIARAHVAAVGPGNNISNAAVVIIQPQTGEVLVRAGEMIDDEMAERLEALGVERVPVRSVLTCHSRFGVCAACYGRNLATGQLVEVGEAVGIIAAQSIGEPGTQLTMRTFHTGGVAGQDITSGLPRVEELFEARVPKGQAVISEIDGVVSIERQDDLRKIKVTASELYRDEQEIPPGYELLVHDGDWVEVDQPLAQGPDGQMVLAALSGRVAIEDGRVAILYEYREEREYLVPATARLRVEDGQRVNAGDLLTEGPANPQDILRIRGREAVQLYLLDEVQKVYRSQGVTIHDKHIEIIIRQMLRKVRVETPGDTELLPGELVDRFAYEEINARVLAEGGEPATAQPVLLGITKASLNTESFLAAASFQETTRVLTEAAINGAVDRLIGLKENVIIGKLIPAGTGAKKRRELAEKRRKILESLLVPPTPEGTTEALPPAAEGGPAETPATGTEAPAAEQG